MLAAAMSFVALFIVQNVFSQQVFTPVRYKMSPEVVVKLTQDRLYDEKLDDLLDRPFNDAVDMTNNASKLSQSGKISASM